MVKGSLSQLFFSRLANLTFGHLANAIFELLATLNPKPQTLKGNPKPETPNIKRKP